MNFGQVSCYCLQRHFIFCACGVGLDWRIERKRPINTSGDGSLSGSLAARGIEARRGPRANVNHKRLQPIESERWHGQGGDQ